MASLFVLPFSLLNSVLNPIVTRRNLLTDFKREEIRLFLYAILASAGVVLFCGWFLGPWVIKILYGERILTYARLPFYIILLGQIFHLFKIFSQPFITKFFSPNSFLNIQMISAGTFLVLQLILVPRFGIIGAAIATSVSFTLMGLLYFKNVILAIRSRVFALETA
jgi:O-antigen/teichoic acid export membrane protein